MSNLINMAKRNFGESTAAFIGRFFERATLPIPKENAVYRTSDQGYMVFLNQFACTVRVTNDDRYPLLRHARILKPLYTERFESTRISINPGIRIGTSANETEFLKRTLSDGGICFHDRPKDNDNSGYLPQFDPDYAVLLDTPAVGIEDKELYQSSLSDDEDSPQDIIYLDLRQAFRRATPGGMANANPDRMLECWDLSAQFKHSGRMVSDWSDMRKSHRGSWYCADNYSLSLYEHPALRLCAI